MLPRGQYVVEVVVPPGYELVKEEDKNILIGDTYIAPVTDAVRRLGSIYILPDQAVLATANNPTNAQNPTVDLGAVPRHEGDTGSVEVFWPCVGASRIVPDFISLFPGSAEVAPFAGAKRNLCDRKLVTLDDEGSVLAKFYIYTSTHAAAPLHRHHYRRLHVRVRSVLAHLRREVLAGQPAGGDQGLGRKRDLARVFGSVGKLHWPDLTRPGRSTRRTRPATRRR